MGVQTLASAGASSRDADWRFLLPPAPGGSFEHLVLLGGTAALAATIVDLGVARRVSLSLRPGERADAVVVLAGASGLLSAVADQLVDGGVLYWETDRRRRGRLSDTPSRQTERLRRLGLTLAGIYWVKPGFPDRDMYLPLGAAAALGWYLDTLYRATTRPRRAMKAALQTWNGGGRFDLLVPCYAIVAVRGAARAPALIERAREAGIAIPDGAQPALLAHGRREWSRVAVPVFRPGERAPVRVIKLPRTARFNDETESEHQTLHALGARLRPPLRDSVPGSSLFQWNGLAVTVETCLGGSALTTRAGLALPDAEDDLELASAWLAGFHEATMMERAPARDWLTQRLVIGLMAEYAITFGVTAAEKQLFRTMTRALDAEGRLLLPIVWQHADFGPWNVYREGDRVGVIDWEVARLGPVLVDLIYFVTHWTAASARIETDHERALHVESLFCGIRHDGTRADAIHRQIAEYMQRLRIAPSLLPFLVVYTFLEQALDRAHRLASLAPETPATREDNLYVGCIGALARHAGSLFPVETRHAA